MIYKYLLLPALLIHGFAGAQTFLNGSFENNSVTTCEINTISNLQFNALMPYTYGIGATETIDVFDATVCPSYGTAQEGNFYVSVENNSADSTQSTMISLQLSDTLQAGSTYTFCYYDRGLFTLGYGPIALGLSSNNSTFGTQIYVSPILDTVWTQRTVTFVAPVTGNYITVKYAGLNGGGIVDDFGACTKSSVNENSNEGSFGLFPNPSSGSFLITSSSRNENRTVEIFSATGQLVHTEQWMDSDSKEIKLDCAPGIYFVQIKTGEAIESRKLIIE